MGTVRIYEEKLALRVHFGEASVTVPNQGGGYFLLAANISRG